jgi:hypothetical protein
MAANIALLMVAIFATDGNAINLWRATFGTFG